ncbi:hypothetical protein P167DRAFT_255454 [Morchella conica CCBAS932]|uniref:Uncharacterized protein n=1 Tax=Morchella conica CCBAS932 TaxID=1392247 RepID=A0A3N4KIV7_9PEZI|nr:hypothetical protein P167DRAFT_255454 [Morchella conica CCBAS932]
MDLGRDPRDLSLRGGDFPRKEKRGRKKKVDKYTEKKRKKKEVMFWSFSPFQDTHIFFAPSIYYGALLFLGSHKSRRCRYGNGVKQHGQTETPMGTEPMEENTIP